MAATHAMAQAAGPSAVEEVVVTGTSIRGVSAVGSKAIVLGEEELKLTGYNNPIEVLRNLPQVQGLGYDEVPHIAQNGQANVQRGTTISLRGLSSSATLLLIDGRRIAVTGNVTSFTEANQLPVSFIQRVDVVADGASAIYGSDAVAGVVNYITRKSFEGIEATARYTTNSGYDQYGGSIVMGRNWDLGSMGPGGVVFAFDHDHRSPMLQGHSRFLKQDLRPLGGPDNRIRTNQATSAAPGNIIVPGPTNTTLPTAGAFTYYGVPPGYSGTGLNGSALLLNQPNLLDAADYTDHLPLTERNQASLNINQEIAEGFSVYYQGYVNRRKSKILGLIQSGIVTVPANSPFYIPNVPGLAAGAAETVSFSFLKDIGRGVIGLGGGVLTTSTGHTVGAKKDLWGDWRGETIFTSSFARTCANCIPALNGNVFAAQLQAAVNDGSYNPFNPNAASPATLARFLVEGSDRNRSLQNQTSLRLDGSLFELPAGKVRVALGGEHIFISQARSSIGIKATSDTVGAFGSRKIDALYGEVFLPVVGPDMNVPLVRSLDLDLALRAEKYSDFGKTTNPKVGMVWGIVDGLKVRGSWGTSFRAPALTEASTKFFSSVGILSVANGANDPAIPLSNTATRQTFVLRLAGSNPELTPEEAENVTFGVDFEPTFAPGLRLSGTYYKVSYDNQIVGLQTVSTTFLSNAVNRALYAPYITVASQPATCVAGNRATYNPIYAAAFGEPSLVQPDEANACALRALFTARNTNAASTVQDGLDLQASYVLETDIGRFNFGLDATYILNNRIKVVASAPEVDGLDRINYPISKRGRASVGWTRSGLTANLAVNYIGSYTNDLPITIAGVTRPIRKVPAWGTLDGALVYQTEREEGWLSGVRLSLNIQNILDRDPPTVLSTNVNAGGADIQTHSVLGRIVSMQISKAF